MRTLGIDYNIGCLPIPNESHIVLDEMQPPIEFITAAFALAFEGDRLLVAHLANRGWDIPGGHLEPGETPVEAMRREVYEETRVRLDSIELIGHQKMIIRAPKPAEYRYPYPIGYQVFYWGQVALFDSFVETKETLGRGLFSPGEARDIEWVRGLNELYEYALAKAGYGRA
jgi:8-oxo-dGTP diphosphatase